MLRDLEDVQRDLAHVLTGAPRWARQVKRHLRVRAVQGSVAIDGLYACAEDVEAIMAGEAPLQASARVARAIAGYRQVLTYIRLLSGARGFAYDVGLLNALSFMMNGETPDLVRTGRGYVRNCETHEVIYEGPDAREVPALLDELVKWLNSGDVPAPAYVRAAMAHLNLVEIRPWCDGNGRVARALQTLILGRGQVGAPGLSSIEEWLGQTRITFEYYDVLGEVGRDRWSPHDGTLPWIRFCLRAHHMQVQRVAQRLREAGEIWMLLEGQVDGLNPRVISALYEIFVNRRLRRSRYQEDESLTQGQAARDLRNLAAGGWLRPSGRFYAPGPRMAAIKAEFAERREPLRDPYRSTG
ncbi:Fic family protein [Nonomuraea typhae]|uniref:Fic family protein n=1 Tax=Nonomuraea typhae TaxID=2603600 RepID=A0ABW7Z386_9ACTN